MSKNKKDPSKENNKEILTEDEIKTLLYTSKEYDEWIYNFILVSLFTGMRRGETLGLGWPNINFENNEINVKQKLVYIPSQGINIKPIYHTSRRKIIVKDKVISSLKKIKNEQITLQYLLKSNYNNKYNLVFCNDHGELYHPSTVTKKFKKIVIISFPHKDKSDINLHSLRKTYTYLLFKNNVNTQSIKNNLGLSHSRNHLSPGLY